MASLKRLLATWTIVAIFSQADAAVAGELRLPQQQREIKTTLGIQQVTEPAANRACSEGSFFLPQIKEAVAASAPGRCFRFLGSL